MRTQKEILKDIQRLTEKDMKLRAGGGIDALMMGAEISRLRDRVEQLEKENLELKEENRVITGANFQLRSRVQELQDEILKLKPECNVTFHAKEFLNFWVEKRRGDASCSIGSDDFEFYVRECLSFWEMLPVLFHETEIIQEARRLWEAKND